MNHTSTRVGCVYVMYVFVVWIAIYAKTKEARKRKGTKDGIASIIVSVFTRSNS